MRKNNKGTNVTLKTVAKYAGVITASYLIGKAIGVLITHIRMSSIEREYQNDEFDE